MTLLEVNRLFLTDNPGPRSQRFPTALVAEAKDGRLFTVLDTEGRPASWVEVSELYGVKVTLPPKECDESPPGVLKTPQAP